VIGAIRLTQSGGAQLNQILPEIVWLGAADAQIQGVTRQRVEYLNEAAQECFVDLDECARYWQLQKTDEDDFDPLDSEDSDATYSLRGLNYVGKRGMLDDPPWIEFTNKRRTRFVFGSLKQAREFKLQLMRVRCYTLDGN
jgi:hypothetical protein